MTMQEHVIAATREQYEKWLQFLSRLDPSQCEATPSGDAWTIKDHVAHLNAWQQRSNARLDAALAGHEPRYPTWNSSGDTESHTGTQSANEWIYAMNKNQSWPQVVDKWKRDFEHLLVTAEKFSERDFLDSDRYVWMEGYSLADVLLATYEHHQEHLEWVSRSLQR